MKTICIKTAFGLIALTTSYCYASDALTLEALSKGHASGTMSEDIASNIKAKTRSNAPVYMDVRLVKRYAQEGCGRLAYIVKQEKVPTTDGKLVPLVMNWQMNVCMDGNPPREPMIEVQK